MAGAAQALRSGCSYLPGKIRSRLLIMASSIELNSADSQTSAPASNRTPLLSWSGIIVWRRGAMRQRTPHLHEHALAARQFSQDVGRAGCSSS
jgi:hypothetical protein